MKFNDALSHIPVGERVGPLIRTDMSFSCFVCTKKTGWVYSPDRFPVHICSEECMDSLEEWKKERGEALPNDTSQEVAPENGERNATFQEEGTHR